MMCFGHLGLHGHFDIFVPFGVNRSGRGTSSTTNYIFYMALGRLSGCRGRVYVSVGTPMHGGGYHQDIETSMWPIPPKAFVNQP